MGGGGGGGCFWKGKGSEWFRTIPVQNKPPMIPSEKNIQKRFQICKSKLYVAESNLKNISEFFIYEPLGKWNNNKIMKTMKMFANIAWDNVQ